MAEVESSSSPAVTRPQTQDKIPVPAIVAEPSPEVEAQDQSHQAAEVAVATAVDEPDIPFFIGPSGGEHGVHFSTGIIPPGAEVRTIHVRHGALIKAAGITYELDGTSVDLPLRGGDKGAAGVVPLVPGEYVTKIAGKYGRYVDSLVIHTSTGRSYPFGGDGGTVSYEYAAPPGREICGFSGNAGDFVNAIGPIFRRCDRALPPNPGRLRQGPAGGFAGSAFEDDTLPDGERIVGVRLWDGPSLNGIALLYGTAQAPRVLGTHGGCEGHPQTFMLEDDEYVIGLQGCYDSVVRGIRILTNKRLSEPFGWENEGVPFVFKINALDGPGPAAYEVVGLFGQEDTWIVNALGVVYRRRRIVSP